MKAHNFSVSTWEEMMESMTTPSNLLKVEFALKLLNLQGLEATCRAMQRFRNNEDEVALHSLFCTVVGVINLIENNQPVKSQQAAYARGMDIAFKWWTDRQVVTL